MILKTKITPFYLPWDLDSRLRGIPGILAFAVYELGIIELVDIFVTDLWGFFFSFFFFSSDSLEYSRGRTYVCGKWTVASTINSQLVLL